MVAKILEVDKPVPWPVKSITKKHMNPPKREGKLTKTLYKLLPRANFKKSLIYYFLISWIIFLKAISHPYNLIDLIPYMIYRHVFILLSLQTLTFYIIFPLIFPKYVWSGIKTIATIGISNPGHPRRVTKITRIAIIANGVTKAHIVIIDVDYITLKSFDIKLIILPSYCIIAVYWVILDNLI